MLTEKEFCHPRLGFDLLIQDFLSSKVLDKHLPDMDLTSEGKVIGSIYSNPDRNNPTLHLRVFNRDKRRTLDVIVTNYLDILALPSDPYILDIVVRLYGSAWRIKDSNYFEVSPNGKIVDFVGFLDYLKYTYIQRLFLWYLYDLYPDLKDM